MSCSKEIILLVFALFAVVSANDVQSKLACEWQELKLECPRGELLTVISANYGRTSSAVCSHEGNTNCHAPNSLDVVKTKCNGLSSCSVMARNDVFGDPCYGTVKYLEVQYSCKPAPPCPQFKCDDGKCISKKSICDGKRDCAAGEDELGCSYNTAYGCEHGTLNIECRKGELIRILYGNYGRTNPNICQIENKPHCVSPVADNIIKEQCDLKRSCSIPATNNVFGDPCYGTLKYAEAHYTCWKNYSIAIGCENATLSIECKKGELIRILYGNYGRTDPHICKNQPEVNCVSGDTIITERCHLKRSCSIPATYEVFGDPCYETVKYAEAHYNCWKMTIGLPED